MGVVKQKPFIASTRYTMSITDIQCKTCVVCKISLLYYFIFIYVGCCVLNIKDIVKTFTNCPFKAKINVLKENRQ